MTVTVKLHPADASALAMKQKQIEQLQHQSAGILESTIRRAGYEVAAVVGQTVNSIELEVPDPPAPPAPPAAPAPEAPAASPAPTPAPAPEVPPAPPAPDTSAE
jgi:pyruvate/2-oxoglutarate dehydrogenase complex dihydrolipoamide acyltransferase (E2) component